MENINFKEIKKILIIGGPGMGKSTLADKISEHLNLPAYHLDAIHFQNNWTERNTKERDEIILQKIEEEKWVLDGLYKTTLQESIEKSDLVIILWFSKYTQLKGTIKRHIKNYGKERNDIPGCIDKLELRFLKFVLNFKKRNQSVIENILKKDNKQKVIFFSKQKELNKWFKMNFNAKLY